MVAIFGLVQPAFSDITNTATVSGTYAGNTTTSAPATASVQVTPAQAVIGLVKTAGPIVDANGNGVTDVGDTLNYSFKVTNLGNVSFKTLSITDSKVANITCPAGDLLPTNSVTCTGNPYVIKLADMDAGQVSNTAVVTGTTATAATAQDNSDPVTSGPSAQAPTIVTLPPTAKLTLTKNGAVSGPLVAGSVINYTFLVKNTGTVTVNGITLADTQANAVGGPIASLAPGNTDGATFTASHVLTAGDISAGTYSNTATVTGTPAPPASANISASGSVSTVLNSSASMSFSKSAVLNSIAAPPKKNDGVTYTFKVKNTGTSPLFNVTVTDPMLADNAARAQHMVALLDTALKPASDEITTASIDAPQFSSGIVEAAKRRADQAKRFTGNTALPLAISREVVRMSSLTGALQAGEKIGFLYTVENTEDGPASNLQIAQPDSFAVGGHISLLSGHERDSTSGVFTRELTAQEADTGQVQDNGYITFTFGGHELMQIASETLSLQDLRNYDSFATASISPTVITQLDPGLSATFTAPYLLSQADVDAGTVHNDAQATATDVGNGTLIKLASFDLPLTRAPKIGMVKTATLAMANGSYPLVNDVITYHFAVSNLGNVMLSAVNVTDVPLGFAGTIASLAPAATDTSLTAAHTLSQADIDAGFVQNQAHAVANAPGGATPQADSDFTDPNQHRPTKTLLISHPVVGLVKKVTSITDTNANGRNDVGDVINYQFTIYNLGNVTLSNLVVTDKPAGGANVVIAGSPVASLLPGLTSTVVTGAYAIAQTDMDAGHVDNTALVKGLAPDGTKVTDESDPAVPTSNGPTIKPLGQVPQIRLYKTMDISTFANGWEDVNHDGIIDAGDKLHYAFTVENLGNVTLTNLVLQDALATATVANLKPGNTLAPAGIDGNWFKATYTVATADEAAGFVHNSATVTADEVNSSNQATATSLNGTPAQNNPGTTDTPIQPTPTVAIVLLAPSYADTNGDGVQNAGDTLSYQIKVKNTGTVPISNIIVSDNATGLTFAGGFCHIAGPIAPGAEDTATCTATHVLSAAEVAAGVYNAQAKVLATAATGGASGLAIGDVSDPVDYTKNAPTPFAIAANPKIASLKALDHFENAGGTTVPGAMAGGFAVYKITVKNIGNIAFDDVVVAENVGFSGTVSGTHPFALAIGATDSSHFTVKQAISNADMFAGQIADQVIATGSNTAKGLSAIDLSDASDLTKDNPTITAVTVQPGFAVVKSFTVQDTNGNGANDAGDVIKYTFKIQNTGNVDLSNITIVDAQAVLPVMVPTLPLLHPGAIDTVTFTAVHLITDPEVTAGTYSNQATFTATYDTINNLTISSDTDNASLAAVTKHPTVTPLSRAKPVLTKVAGRSQVKRGEVVPYTITATNLATAQFQIADIMPPGFSFVAGSAIANGVAVVPVVNGSIITFNGLTPTASKITLTLKLVSSVTIGGGKFVNNARLIEQATNQVLAVAQASVEITPDATFDCSDIIGRVFDDLNGDGYYQAGEPGLPGVRLATVNGQLITTDAEGRYHIPCAAIPEAAIGSNFLLKLDPRTLPQGYKVTSENPRDVRLTRGKMAELNFGATKTHDVKVDVTGRAFVADDIQLVDAWAKGVDRLCKVLVKNRAELHLIYHQGGESGELAQARIESLLSEVQGRCTTRYPLVIKTSVEEGK